jgi:hypothetical protein
MLLCGDPLDHGDRATYVELSEALKKFINENAKSEAQKISPDHNEKLRQHREMRVREGFCNQPEYTLFKKQLLSIMRNREEGQKIRKRLETPSDPSKGDCF